MIESYKKFLKNYNNFSGRTSRRDYWLVFAANLIVGFILGLITGLVPALNFLAVLCSLALLVPSIALCVRRLHDINKSAWFLLFAFVPFVGSLILLIFYCLPSVDENNNYTK